MGPNRRAGIRAPSRVKRLLLVQPSLQPPGGGSAVAVRAVEALKDEYDIVLLAWDPVDFDAINRYYGTALSPSDLTVRLAPRGPYWLRRLIGLRGALWQRYLMLRWARPIAGDFDVVLSVNNEIDVGVPAIQYVHFPWGYWPRPDADRRWYHWIPGVLRLYYALGARLAPVSPEAVRRNCTLVNSDWTGARFRERYGGETETLYPPVFGAPAPPVWTDREDAFAVVGVLSPEKRVETAIDILDRVRTAGRNVQLRIIGSTLDRRYLRRIRALVAQRPWATLHENLSRAELLQRIAQCRYGLHAMPDEHFGIAVAEMAASGCIVFVPDDGGQKEIVGQDPRLVYRSPSEATEKIRRVLDDEHLQQQLRGLLAEQATSFSWPAFRDRLRGITREHARAQQSRNL